MAKKKSGKSEKLSQIVAELQKLKSEVKSLGKQQAELAVAIDKLSAPKAKKPKKPVPVRKRAKPAPAPRKAAAAPKRPVLVSPDTAAG